MAEKLEKSCYMMATACQYPHQSRIEEFPEADLCSVSEEDEENYYGSWASGVGFFGVKFPKATTRPLTEEEREHYNGMRRSINSTPIAPLRIDKEDDDARG